MRKARGMRNIMYGDRVLLCCLALCCLLALTSCPASAAKDRVLARVNGEAIHERDLLANMPTDSFNASIDDLKVTKLERLIQEAVLRQFLRTAHVTVPDKTIETDIADLQKNPPSAGCMCCRYKSLQDFMNVNAYTLDELRADIRNNEGVDQYLRRQWEQKYPTREARLAYARHERGRITKSHVKLWHIFFNTFQQAGYSSDPERVAKEKRTKAQAAWQRLQHGDAFAAVAGAVSDDQMTRAKGGALGCLARDTFGDDVKTELTKLKPGAYSKPIESIWGYHIMKWAPMSDQDIVGVLKEEFMDARREAITGDITKKAHIVRNKV